MKQQRKAWTLIRFFNADTMSIFKTWRRSLITKCSQCSKIERALYCLLITAINCNEKVIWLDVKALKNKAFSITFRPFQRLKSFCVQKRKQSFAKKNLSALHSDFLMFLFNANTISRLKFAPKETVKRS